MRITIETDHVGHFAGLPSWDALQTVILTALYGERDDPRAIESHMVRIHRNDGGANYRAHGEYTVTLRDGATVHIHSEA